MRYRVTYRCGTDSGMRHNEYFEFDVTTTEHANTYANLVLDALIAGRRKFEILPTVYLAGLVLIKREAASIPEEFIVIK